MYPILYNLQNMLSLSFLFRKTVKTYLTVKEQENRFN
jgi:hypothetical protein